jgi:3-phytase
MAHAVSFRRTQAARGSLRHAPTLLRLMLVAVLAAALAGLNVLIAPQAHAADVLVTPSAETTPVPSSSDAADDTAIWIHPTDPSQSMVIGTDKLSTGGVGVYDLSGRQLHFYPHGSMNNVDLRYNFPLGSARIALVGVTERNVESTGVRFYKVNVADRSLTEVGRISTPGRPRGFAMYHSPVSGKYHAFVHDFNTNVVTQFELDGSNGSVRGTAVRSFDNGDSSEGISADDELQRVYVSEEKVGLWRYGAEPGHGSTRTLVDRTVATGGRIVENVKNSAIYYGRQGTGYLIVSSQGGSNFLIYNRGDNAFVGSFKIVDGGGVDGVNGQDGIDVTNFPLGPSYPAGLFTSQDHNNTNAGNGNSGNQNHKLVSWQRIADAFSPRLLVDTTFDPRQVGAEDAGGDPGPGTTTTPSLRSGADVVAATSDGVLWNYPANGHGGFQARQKIGVGWSGLAKGFVTDWNSDGTLDVVAQWKDGGLSFYAGRPTGGFQAARAIGTGWGSYHITVGHWRKTDRHPGILAYDAAGTLWYYANSAGSSLSPRIKTGTGWGGLYLTMTDFNQDGAQDVLAKRSDGRLVLYRSTGTGSLISEVRPTVGTGWSSINSITNVAGFTAGSTGLITRLTDGRLAHYPFSNGNWAARTIVGSGWSPYNIFR